MECRVRPIRLGDAVTLAAFDRYFGSRDVSVVSVTAAVCDRAATVRAQYGYRPMDALHLAAAVEHGCSRFLTHDQRLSSFSGVPVEVLA
jgi:predicted nucleic acid-binding protein